MIEHLFANVFVYIDLRSEIGVLGLEKKGNNQKEIDKRLNGPCLSASSSDLFSLSASMAP